MYRVVLARNCRAASSWFVFDGFWLASCVFFFRLLRFILRAGRNSPPAVSRCDSGSPRAPDPAFIRDGVSRSGEMPEPTVIVRMKEDKTDIAGQTLPGWLPHGYFCLPFHALILVLVFLGVLP